MEEDLVFDLVGTKQVLFNVTAQTNPDKVEELDEAADTLSVTANIETPWREPSEITIGDPLVFPVLELYKIAKQPVPATAQFISKTHELYLVQLTCAFTPAPDTRFTRARFQIELTTTYPAGTSGNEKAIALDLFPDETNDEIKVTKKLSLSPELKIKPKLLGAEVEATLKVGEASTTEEYTVYVPRIEISAKQTSRVFWIFLPTKAHELRGGKELVMLIRKPKGSEVTAKYSLTAENEIVLPRGPITAGLMNMRYHDKKKQLVDAPEKPLC